MLLAISSSHIALYQVSVRWVRCLPLTSFRFQLAMDTLVSLAGRFPLPGLVRDLHPLDDTHAGQTKSGRTATDTDVNCLSFRLLCGPGGDRTLVQTGKPYAFYMLISLLDCRAECGAGTALHNAVSSENFICGMRLPPTISDMLHHTGQEASGKTALG